MTPEEQLKKARVVLNRWMNDVVDDHDALLTLYDLIVEGEK